MILADENIDHRTIQTLRESGISIFSIFEEMPGIDDEQVIEFSLQPPPRIILTRIIQ